MKAQDGVIQRLNSILTNELTAINQYFLHARMYKNWGLIKLGDVTYKESIGEMKHADLLIERVLMLDGLPNLQDMHKLKVGEEVPECLAADLAVEYKGRETLLEAIVHFESVRDFVSREIATKILDDTEEHIDYLETQISLVEKLGLQNYLQSAMGELPG
jgi:bacterioferritin